MGSGSEIAAAVADVTLTGSSLERLPEALALGRATMATIRQNLFWAFAYNAAGIPLAAGVLYSWTGGLLSPVFASAAMALSSVSVVANSLRLRRFGRSRYSRAGRPGGALESSPARLSVPGDATVQPGQSSVQVSARMR